MMRKNALSALSLPSLARAVMVLGLGVLILTGLSRTARAEEVRVFAAASLQNLLEDAALALAAQEGITLTPVIAGSSVIARQVANGAPADLVLLANAEWMAWLIEQGAAEAESARDLASNRLVVIGPAGSEPVDDWQAALIDAGRLALALTEEVPAGIYARQTLETAGLWQELQPVIVETDHVRAAQNLVAIGAVPRGIVYASDALGEPRLSILASIDPALHAPIRLRGALTPGAPRAAASVMAWLSGVEGAALFAAHGFEPALP